MAKDSFKTRLEIAKKKINKNKNNEKNHKNSNFGEAFKVSTELVAAVAVGTIIGFILDNWFGTKPWLILIFFFVGVIAGISNVIRSAKKYAKINLLENKMASNPMYQFNVYRIGPEIKIGEVDLSFTNASLFMVISSLAVLIIFNLGSKKNSLIPNKIQLLAELSYTFVSKMISDTAGSKAKPYFSFIFSLFMFVLFCNMFGMIPYAFTVTSHIIVTFVFSSIYFFLELL